MPGTTPRARLICTLISVLSLAGCSRKSDHKVFKLLSPTQTGVAFANQITTNDSINVQTDVYVYNGAGVAVGDIDNDGLPDIFFSGNMVSSRLYLNKGKMRFEDITDRSRVATKSWATGATMVDINGDGYLDIYVSVSGPQWSKGAQRANLLLYCYNRRAGHVLGEALPYGGRIRRRGRSSARSARRRDRRPARSPRSRCPGARP